MDIDNEQTNSDVSTESSSETQTSSAETGTTSTSESSEAGASQETKSNTEDNLPFHQHPRFQELVEQKNRSAKEADSLKQQIAQMQSQFEQLRQQNAPKSPEDALIARLKGIDPEFGGRFEKLDAMTQELENLREWRRTTELDNVKSQALGQIKDLHAQNKVPESMQSLYQTQIEAAVRGNPNARLEDLGAIYKGVHDQISKLLDGIKRSERESYVKGKTQDSNAPTTQPKGKSVSASKESDFSANPDEARSQLIGRILKESKANSSI